MIWNFNSFGLVYVLTAGGPGGKTMLPMLFAYNEAFRYGNFGYAAAMGDVMVVVIVVFLPSTCGNRLTERGDDDTRPASPRRCQYVALVGYLVFLGFPLLWLVSTAFKSPQELASLDADAAARARSTAGQLHATRSSEQGLVRRGAATACRSRSLTTVAASLIAGAAGGVRAGPVPQPARPVATGWILVSQVFPVDPDHHPAVPGAAARCT